MIEIRVTGLDNLADATGEMRKWGERPFDGGAALRIRKNWMSRIGQAFETKGQSIGTKWKPLSPSYAAWKGRHFPGRPLLVLRGTMKQSLTSGGKSGSSQSSRNAIFNRKGGRQLILGTRIKYAKFHQYGTNKTPARPFFKVDQGLVNDWAREMAKDVKLAEEGSRRWSAR
tara:strand:+ start:346 stop:858 length:513 start_codon:yes stop_codon:yes gene_type:complete